MKTIVLENDHVVLEINPKGGAYTSFHLKDLPLNPLNWAVSDPSLPPFKGHFLCFDRWGPPSEAEKGFGFRHHGEANTVKWKMLKKPHVTDDSISCSMRCRLPMGRMELTRCVELPKEEPVFLVTEKIRNLSTSGRIYNIVQHVTLAPPFLDMETLFDNNTEKGFEDKEDGSLSQENPVLKWKDAIMPNGEKTSLRHFRQSWPRVSSFTFMNKKKYGWTTAVSPDKNLLLGYIWKIDDYPWINFWRDMKQGLPVAFGMEFGTTGLHEPMKVVAQKGKIFDRNIFEFIDADEIITKSFAGFLTKVPDNYTGVEQIRVGKTSFTLKERAKKSRDITFQITL